MGVTRFEDEGHEIAGRGGHEIAGSIKNHIIKRKKKDTNVMMKTSART
jgi:hypothetical protein